MVIHVQFETSILSVDMVI